MSSSIPLGSAGSTGIPGDVGLKDVLFDMFKSRQGGFEKVPGTGTELPGFPNQNPDSGLLPGGGLAWGFIDPSWFAGPAGAPAAQPGPNTMAEVLTTINQNRRGHGGQVSGQPAQDPIEWNPNDPLGDLHAPPMPPPLTPNGYWKWFPRGGGGGDPGTWQWIEDNPGFYDPRTGDNQNTGRGRGR